MIPFVTYRATAIGDNRTGDMGRGGALGRGADIPQNSRQRVLESPAGGGAEDVARRELIAGLMAPDAFVSPKYFYDAAGSRLFEAITALPEYYLTRTERALLSRYGREIARRIGPGTTLIDLGAGNCEKAKTLFKVLQPSRYVAVDVAADFLRRALAGLADAFPAIEMLGVCADISSGIILPGAVPLDRRLFFYPGSSIGNFTPDEALSLLQQIHEQCAGEGGLLIGVDLVKAETVLDAAYNDAGGVTAAFNLNLLNHINALIGSDFVASDWRHVAFFDAAMARIEMHLQARRTVRVTWPNGSRGFAEGERIHTEYSYKYELADFEDLLVRAGFRDVRHWTDAHRWFAVLHASA
jgi:dimethylhistidine N-methyltransferase